MDINLSLITPGLQNFFWPTGAKIVAHKQTTAQCNFSHAAFGVKGMTVLFSNWVANTEINVIFSGRYFYASLHQHNVLQTAAE